jgi:hypothetical protein
MKVDFKKTLDSYQAKQGQFRILEVPPLQYLMIDGHGDPNTAPEFNDALAALYPVAYKLKFMSKSQLGRDYVVPPAEGLWWAKDMDTFTITRDKSAWDWTMMLLVPEWITPDHFEGAVEQVVAKGAPAGLTKLRLDTLNEGTCVQTLYIGSYDDEGPTLDQLHHEFIPAHGFQMAGKHHEIYFSDFRKTAPNKLRTILRQPVQAHRFI